MINLLVNLQSVQAGKNVPTMVSGVTHISQHREISLHKLLKIMLWTCRGSATRVARPVILSLIVARNLIDQINFAEIEAATHGL